MDGGRSLHLLFSTNPSPRTDDLPSTVMVLAAEDIAFDEVLVQQDGMADQDES